MSLSTIEKTNFIELIYSPLDKNKRIKLKEKKTKENTKNNKQGLIKPVYYSGGDFNLPSSLTGNGTVISVLGEGAPSHKGIRCKGGIVDFTSFRYHNGPSTDLTGFSTFFAGLISCKQKDSLIGFAPDAVIHYLKVRDDEGNISFNSIVSSILWSIIKGVDVIVMPFVTNYNYYLLRDVINKAYNAGIILISAVNNRKNDNLNPYPAAYPEVLSVTSLPRVKKNHNKIKKEVDIALPYKKYVTTFLLGDYADTYGPIASLGVVTSLCSLIIENNLINKGKVEPAHKVITKLKNVTM